MLITQDIRRGDVVIVFDPKGDAGLMIRCYIEATLAGRDFFMFHLGYPDISARYNPIGNFARTTEVSTRVAGQLPGEGQSAAFKEFVWRFVNVIARARTTLGYRPDYSMIYEDAVNIDALALEPVSYTHLDVYKRQIKVSCAHFYKKCLSLNAVHYLQCICIQAN